MVGIRIIPKLGSGGELHLAMDLSVHVDTTMIQSLEAEVKQAWPT